MLDAASRSSKDGVGGRGTHREFVQTGTLQALKDPRGAACALDKNSIFKVTHRCNDQRFLPTPVISEEARKRGRLCNVNVNFVIGSARVDMMFWQIHGVGGSGRTEGTDGMRTTRKKNMIVHLQVMNFLSRVWQ